MSLEDAFRMMEENYRVDPDQPKHFVSEAAWIAEQARQLDLDDSRQAVTQYQAAARHAGIEIGSFLHAIAMARDQQLDQDTLIAELASTIRTERRRRQIITEAQANAWHRTRPRKIRNP